MKEELMTLENEDITEAEGTDQNIEAEIEIANIEVGPIEEIDIEIEDSMGWVGGDSTRHYSLVDRDEADSHPIKAITGLREELNQIEALQTVYSDKKQQADYYMWLQDDDHEVPTDPYGVFVSIYPETDNIYICDGDHDVFGVTVAEAAFVGGQEYVQAADGAKIGRDGKYCAVVHSGFVAVRCETTVVAGDYVSPNSRGEAKKSDGKYGYLVSALSDVNGVSYALISLTMSSSLFQDMAEDVQDLSERMVVAEYNITSVTNVANSAYALAQEAKENADISSDYIEEKVEEVLGRMDEADGIIGNLSESINSANTNAALAQAIAQGAVGAANAMKDEAVAKANEAINESTNTRKDFEQAAEILNRDIQVVRDEIGALEGGINDFKDEVTDNYVSRIDFTAFQTENETAIAAVKKEASETYATITSVTSLETDTSSAISSLRQEVTDNYTTKTSFEQFQTDTSDAISASEEKTSKTYATKTELTSFRGETNTAMANLSQKADANGAYIQGFVSNVNKYSYGPYSQAHRFTYEEALNILEEGTVYVPDSNHSTEEYRMETYEETDGYDRVECAFLKGYYYTWTKDTNGDNKVKWIPSLSTSVVFSSEHVLGSHNMPYWVAEEDITVGDVTYEKDCLYKWDVRTIDGVEYRHWIKVASLQGNLGTVTTSIFKQTSNSIEAAVTDINNNYAGTKAWVDENKAVIEEVVSWQGENSESIATTITQASENSAYIGQIASVKNEDGTINAAASIITAVNDDTSGVTISADHLNLQGKVTISALDADTANKLNNSIASTTIEYALSDSPTTAPTSSWSTTAPEWQEDKYMWQKTTITYTGGKDDTVTTTCIQGARGTQGERGTDGDGVEYKYCLIKSDTKPTYPAPMDASYDWTDEPSGVSEEYPYEYVVSIIVSAIESTAKKINTEYRTFTEADWQKYGQKDHEENWTIRGDGDLNNSHIYLGDYAYVEGEVTDSNPTQPAKIYGKVIELNNSSTTGGHIRMRSELLVIGDYNTPTSNVALWAKWAKDGDTPVVGENGNWFINGQDTGIKAKGNDGVSVTKITPQYHLSGSQTEEPTSNSVGWITDFDAILSGYWDTTRNDNKYIWYREKVEYDNDNIDYTDARVETSSSAVAKWCDTNDKTKINGAHIATGTITANHIETDNLAAITANLGTVYSGCIQSSEEYNNEPIIWETTGQYSEGVTFYGASVSGPNDYADTVLAIPPMSENRQITGINSDAFNGNSTITSVTIPMGITSIGANAFRDCTSLQNVEIASTVTAISSSAFYGCTNLKKVNIPVGVTTINSNLFNGCTSLSSIEIPYGVTFIDSYAFAYCSALESITIPDSVTNIYGNAFEGCTGLTSIVLPKSISISSNVFKDCTNLKKVYYKGRDGAWESLISGGKISSGNTCLTGEGTTKYYYSESEPSNSSKNYWYYKDGFKISCDDDLMIDSQYFKVSSDGKIIAHDAYITGKINATSGSFTGSITSTSGRIGGWLIESDVLGVYGNNSTYYFTSYPNRYFLSYEGKQIPASGDSYPFGSTSTTNLNTYHLFFRNKFAVDTNGKLWAKDADISGTITADYGNIGGFTISGNNLLNGKNKYDDSNSGVYLGTDGIGLGSSAFYVKNDGSFQAKTKQSYLRAGIDVDAVQIVWSGYSDENRTGCILGFLPSYDAVGFQFVSGRLGVSTIPIKFEVGDDDKRIYTLDGSWYCNNSLINDSDKNLKNNIADIDEKYSLLFNALQPKLYKYNNGESNRFHTGFIAQEVNEALEKANLTRNDFAAICIREQGTENERWGLRYEEFIALNTYEIQKLKKQVTELQNELSALKTQQNDCSLSNE